MADLNWDSVLCIAVVLGTAVGIWVRLRNNREGGR